MVTEETPFQPEGDATSDLQVAPQDSTAGAFQPEVDIPATAPDIGSGGQTEAGGAVADGTVTDPRTYSENEWRKFQSSTDKQISDLEAQNKTLQEQSQTFQQQSQNATLEQDIIQLQQGLTQQFMQGGMEEQVAAQQAQQQAQLLGRMYMTEQNLRQQQDQNKQQQTQLGNQVKMARAYELSVTHKIPMEGLMTFDKPEQMEAHAKMISENNRLKGQVQGNTPAQNYSAGTPQPDIAPTDAEAIIDRYNTGDSGITTDMAREAAKKLGYEL